ncbi:MAG: hypothetical protein EWM51_03655 [Treponema sp.]|nr:MAG: hypothetical protein EWM51_03655 [Treponema sp.]
MIRTDIAILVVRNKKSFNFKVNKNINSFANNWKNNSLDTIRLLINRKEVFSCRVQTVANHPDNRGENDTIQNGKFQVKCFVEPRLFRPRIHGIINTVDMDGQKIDHESMQYEGGYQNGRWLIHSRWSQKTKADTNYAWSLGCFILSSPDLDWLNKHLDSAGANPGDIINGELITI